MNYELLQQCIELGAPIVNHTEHVINTHDYEILLQAHEGCVRVYETCLNILFKTGEQNYYAECK